jgi:ketosteroid isomerase-like protein
MKRWLSWSAGICLLLGSFISEAQAQSRIQDEKEIAALFDRLAAAASAKDIDAVMKCYVQDESLFAFDVAPPRQYVGLSAYRKAWEALSTMRTLDYSVTDLSVVSDGTLAYSHSIHHTSGLDARGKHVELVARISDVFRKINGRWFIVMEHVSIPVDLLTGRADFLSRE